MRAQTKFFLVSENPDGPGTNSNKNQIITTISKTNVQKLSGFKSTYKQHLKRSKAAPFQNTTTPLQSSSSTQHTPNAHIHIAMAAIQREKYATLNRGDFPYGRISLVFSVDGQRLYVNLLSARDLVHSRSPERSRNVEIHARLMVYPHRNPSFVSQALFAPEIGPSSRHTKYSQGHVATCNPVFEEVRGGGTV